MTTKCPVQCAYCLADKFDRYSKYWNSGERLQINKTCVYVNRLPGDPPLSKMDFPWNLFRGDYLGFQGITDPFWKIFNDDLEWLLGRLDDIGARRLRLTSKIPPSKRLVDLMTPYRKKLAIVFSVTGLDGLEKTTTMSRVRAIGELAEKGFYVLPIIHPYIDGLNDLSFFKELAATGVKEISWRGFRCNKGLMNFDIPRIYKDTPKEILLGEEKLLALAENHKMTFVELKDWIHAKGGKARVTEAQAKADAEELISQCVNTSPELRPSKEAMTNEVVRRRLEEKEDP